MDHVLQIFAGLPAALQPFCGLHPQARIYTLTPGADVAVFPFDEAIQDALHRRYGTGGWPSAQGVMLSTTDQAFAAECSTRAPLAYIEISVIGASLVQSAAVWQLGRLTIGPATLDLSGANARRSALLWPVNAALRALGIQSAATGDEATAFGLPAYPTNGHVHAQGWPVYD